ncbi:MAG: hypothetical protein J6X08_07055, partial [Lachnospiraceae bacterium]|nr:hypothetical protein [Lachnospiraceae bacterium]
YVKEKGAPRSLRIALFLMFLLNPLNSYYSISTVKGVFSAAFLIFALTFLLMLFEKKKPVLNSILFVLTSVLSCHFRNNMLYAYIFAGVIILFLVRGLKKKALALLLVVAVCLCSTISNRILLNVFNATDKDGMRETMSVPLVCLARVCLHHADELDPVIYEEIQQYIPKSAVSKYSYIIADPVKSEANEELLKSNTVNFLKLAAKVGLQYPGEYLEAFVGLTVGYYAPLNSPYFITGSTKLYTAPVEGGYPIEEVKYGLPVGGEIFDYLYGPDEGRLRIPLFGMLWRGAPYFWSFIFAFFYLIYRKRPANMCILLIPFMYMLSCLFGPTSFLRYLYINIATLPIAAYLVMSGNPDSDITTDD